MTTPLEVKPEPCLTCPYRKDVPSGVWSFEEYEKLRKFDEQPHGCEDLPSMAIFLCHQGFAGGLEIVCKGWVMVHQHSVAVRLACATGKLDYQTCFDEPKAELHESGNAAADYGQKDIKRPKRKALKVLDKLEKTGRFKHKDEE